MSPCVIWVAGSAADFAGTRIGLEAPNTREGNPLQQSLGSQIALQSLSAGIGCIADHKLSKNHKNGARVLRLTVFALKLYLAQANFRKGTR